jgi:hypothetical protein
MNSVPFTHFGIHSVFEMDRNGWLYTTAIDTDSGWLVLCDAVVSNGQRDLFESRKLGEIRVFESVWIGRGDPVLVDGSLCPVVVGLKLVLVCFAAEPEEDELVSCKSEVVAVVKEFPHVSDAAGDLCLGERRRGFAFAGWGWLFHLISVLERHCCVHRNDLIHSAHRLVKHIFLVF